MADLSTLSALSQTDLNILDAASQGLEPVPTDVMARLVGLSSSQVIKRGKILQSQSLLTMKNGGGRRMFRFSLSSEVTRADIVQVLRTRYSVACDPLARDALLSISDTLADFSESLATLSNQIRTLLKEE